MTGILQGLIGSYLGRNQVNLVISANTSAYDVYTNRGPAYVAGSDITVTVNPGVTVGSQNTAGYALLVPSQFSPTDNITIVNQGSIVGSGGDGGTGGTAIFGTPAGSTTANQGVAAVSGAAGGNAVYVNRPVTITNNGTIASGGGGGGGGGVGFIHTTTAPIQQGRRAGGGGGGGGGAGYSVSGAGGPTAADAARTPPTLSGYYGAGQVGSSGTSTTGGSGGVAGSYAQPPTTYGFLYGGDGGAGGSLGAAGGTGGTGYFTVGPPGSVPGIRVFPPGAAGGGTGFYIVGNPFVTWAVNGTRQGNVG